MVPSTSLTLAHRLHEFRRSRTVCYAYDHWSQTHVHLGCLANVFGTCKKVIMRMFGKIVCGSTASTFSASDQIILLYIVSQPHQADQAMSDEIGICRESAMKLLLLPEDPDGQFCSSDIYTFALM